MNELDRFADRLLSDEPLAKYTAARLGGPADLLMIARSLDELTAVAQAAWADGIWVRIIGGGANVLISDHGVRGLVIVNRAAQVEFYDEGWVVAQSGMALTALARKCAARGFSGFEWAVSVPGTIGGAVVNNAGAHGGDMAGCVAEASVLDSEAGLLTLSSADLAYDYRMSSLKASGRRFLVLSAALALTPGVDPAAINAYMDELVEHRKRTQPPGASLGSIFKNPPGDYAGRLIEAAGLKGFRLGGAMVSPVHANFFINTGTATASDYYALIQHVRAAVEEQTGIILEREVEVIGQWDAN